MNLFDKLAEQQQVRTRNKARFSSPVGATATDRAVDFAAAESPTLQASLEQLRSRMRRPGPRQRPEDGRATDRSAQTFGGVIQCNSNGSFLHRVSDAAFGPGSQQEESWIHRLIQLLGGRKRSCDLRCVVFLDTETTGLAGGVGTVAFLVGLGRWTDSGFCVEQYLMRDYHEERAMLLALQESLATTQVLVTFNGKAFDVPLLQSRFVLARQRWPLARALHLDLLHPARRLWKLRLGNCCLANLESELFGIEREEDVPGHLIPQLYFRYARTGNPQSVGGILSHNRQDIETLARLALRVGEVFSGQSSKGLAPVDLFSAGKYAGVLGERELAMSWNKAALRGDLPAALQIEAVKWIAASLKAQKNYSEAVQLWKDLSERSEVFLEDVHEELAIYYEHRKCDLEEALRLSEHAISQLQSRALLKKWQHRRDRLAMKLARCACSVASLPF
ncbi:MAG: ribonuclease H-like domain-containing protein [Acidobacteria bacterium]|nr:ribonuclease H-like domain-containing protein [Acidobacteriota bacterium]MCI0717569.1 ribonuclease H-like domain-containing protein [Acidobacteriota bacterium]